MATVEVAPAQALEELEQGFGLTPDDLARLLRVRLQTLERWRRGESIPPPETRRRMGEWLELYERLLGIFSRDRDAVQRWLQAPHRYLDWQSPAAMARMGRFDRVEAAIDVLDHVIYI